MPHQHPSQGLGQLRRSPASFAIVDSTQPSARSEAPFQTVSAEILAKDLIEFARNIRLPAFKRHKRGPTKPVPKRTKHTDSPCISTARLLVRARGKMTP